MRTSDQYATWIAITVHSHWLAGASELGDSGDLLLAVQQSRRNLGSGQWPEHLLNHRHQPASLLRAQLVSHFLAAFG